jgi:PBP1b-binding outer membrane lipoprotein LpoB
MRKFTYILMALLIAITLLLASCQPEPAPEPTEAPAVEEPTEAPAAEEPTEAPAAEAPTEEVMLQEGCNEDLTGETFTFYSQAGLTGALSTILGTSFVNALNDAIAEVNATGGVCGA